jgi:hypothetical protein
MKDGLSDINSKVAIEYGSAFHLFKKNLYAGEAWETAAEKALGYFSSFTFEFAQKEFRNLGHLAQTCSRYYNEIFRYSNFKPLRTKDGELLVEKTFAIPVFANDTLEILLTGTVDCIGTEGDGYVIGEDTKTSAVWNQDEFLRLFTLSSQLMFYQVACELIGYEFANKMLWRIDSVFLTPMGATFRKSEPIFFSAEHLALYQSQVFGMVQKIVDCVESEKAWPQNFLCCDSTKYDTEKVGMCKFFPICEKDTTQDAALVKESMYKQKRYEPLKFGKEKI